jgi:hypothetical protein
MITHLVIRLLGLSLLVSGATLSTRILKLWLTVFQRALLSMPAAYMLFSGLFLLLGPVNTVGSMLILCVPVSILTTGGVWVNNAMGLYRVGEFRKWAEQARTRGAEGEAQTFEDAADQMQKWLGHLKQFQAAETE